GVALLQDPRLASAGQWPAPFRGHASRPGAAVRTAVPRVHAAGRLRAPRNSRSYRPLSLGEPAFASPIEFCVAEAFALAARHAKVKLFHVFVLCETFGVAVHHDSAIFQNVAIV